MSKNRLLSLLIALTLVQTAGISLNLSAKSKTALEGQVTDHSTGAPIQDAVVTLNFPDYSSLNTNTNKKGKYKFSDLPENPGDQKFYLQCRASGYVPLIPNYYHQAVKEQYKNDLLGIFTLTAGESKTRDLTLKPECRLNGKISRTDASGTGPFVAVNVTLYRKPLGEFFDTQQSYQISSAGADDKGEFHFGLLEPSGAGQGEYHIRLAMSGYSIPIIRNFQVVMGQENNVTQTVDLSAANCLSGKITVTGSTLKNGSVSITPATPDSDGNTPSVECEFGADGAYFFNGLESGSYNLFIEAYCTDDTELNKKLTVEVVKDKTVTLDITI